MYADCTPHESIALQGIVADAFATSNYADGAAEAPETEFQSVFVTERELPPSPDCAKQVLEALKARLGKEPGRRIQEPVRRIHGYEEHHARRFSVVIRKVASGR